MQELIWRNLSVGRRTDLTPKTPFYFSRKWARIAASWILRIEAGWHRVVLALCLAALYFALCLTGWLAELGTIPRLLFHFFSLIAIAYSFIVAVVSLTTTSRDVSGRLERDNQLTPGLLDLDQEKNAVNVDNPFSQTLWRLHISRNRNETKYFHLNWPKTEVCVRDPFGLRSVAAIILLVSLVANQGSWRLNLSASFWGDGVYLAAEQLSRLDVWISPPQYTQWPQKVLFSSHIEHPMEIITLPSGSKVHVLIDNSFSPDVLIFRQANEEVNPVQLEEDGTSSRRQWVYEVRQDGEITFDAAYFKSSQGETLNYTFKVLEDSPPKIEFVKKPDFNELQDLTFFFRYEDDYTGGSLRLMIMPQDDELEAQQQYVVDPPHQELAHDLPYRHSQNFSINLLESPWAGDVVDIYLIATDAAGQTGESEHLVTRLPQYSFSSPLARAFIEQRGYLSKNMSQFNQVQEKLQYISYWPRLVDSTTIYLGLRSLEARMSLANNLDISRSVVRQLWQMALDAEGELALDARNRLEQSMRLLEQALRRGSPQSEIDALIERVLRDYEDFLSKLPLLEQDQLANGDSQEITTDVEEALRMLQEMQRSGSSAAAQQLLDMLRRRIDQLQGRVHGNGENINESGKNVGEIGRILGDMERLRDDMLRGSTGGETSGLTDRQQELQKRLESLLSQDGGLPEQAYNDLLDALENMMEANRKTEQKQAFPALRAQNQAIDSLRKAIDQILEELSNNRGQDQQSSEGSDGSGDFPYGDSQGLDSVQQSNQARQILEELRKRLGENYRPAFERDYLERLLEYR